jgi:RimJ/RimL family protein N-acetyltransferase
VVVAENPETGEIVGVAEAVPDKSGNAAEAGIVVLERYQGRGLGTLLAKALSKALWEAGVRKVVGYILPENLKAYRLVKRLGGRIVSYYESMYLVEVPVKPIDHL